MDSLRGLTYRDLQMYAQPRPEEYAEYDERHGCEPGFQVVKICGAWRSPKPQLVDRGELTETKLAEQLAEIDEERRDEFPTAETLVCDRYARMWEVLEPSDWYRLDYLEDSWRDPYRAIQSSKISASAIKNRTKENYKDCAESNLNDPVFDTGVVGAPDRVASRRAVLVAEWELWRSRDRFPPKSHSSWKDRRREKQFLRHPDRLPHHFIPPPAPPAS